MKHNSDIISTGHDVESFFKRIRKRIDDNPIYCVDCRTKISVFSRVPLCLKCYWKGIQIEEESKKRTQQWIDYYAGNGEKPK